MNKKELMENMILLATFYHTNLDLKVVNESWYMIFNPYEKEEVSAAIKYFAENDKREIKNFPSPAHIKDVMSLARKEKERIELQIEERLRRMQPYEEVPEPLKVHIEEDQYHKRLERMHPQIERKATYIELLNIRHKWKQIQGEDFVIDVVEEAIEKKESQLGNIAREEIVRMSEQIYKLGIPMPEKLENELKKEWKE